MTPLAERLARMIRAGGPIPVSAYMALCLTDPEHGYYTTRAPIGRQGDFITAPEISQMFGELVGVAFAHALGALPAGRPATLVEAGPGRGTLAADIMRTLARLAPGRVGAVALIEASPVLRRAQEQALAPYARPVFADSFDAVPGDGPVLLVANEFLDALPMRPFVKAGGAWRERMVDLDGGVLAFSAGAAAIDPRMLPPGADAAPEGTVFETAPAREAAVDAASSLIARRGGLGLFFDYGHLQPGFGDTFQAVRDHAPCGVLESPGLADLTSHVDFAPLAAIGRANGCAAALTTQGRFLLSLGLLERAGALGRTRDAAGREALSDAVERLAGPQAMGNLFKVLALACGLPLPDGLPPAFADAIQAP